MLSVNNWHLGLNGRCDMMVVRHLTGSLNYFPRAAAGRIKEYDFVTRLEKGE